MLYRIYTQFMKKSVKEGAPAIILGAVGNDETDALLDCLKHDPCFGARIHALYNSVCDSHPLPLEVVRQLSHECEISIKELKKSAVRLAFFIDENFLLLDDKKKKAIVLLWYFPKRDDKKYTQRNIKKAQQIRDKFLKKKKIDCV